MQAMMGRQKLVEYEQHGQALVEDGHAEGRMLLELLQEVKRLQASEWSPESLRDALDTATALYLGTAEGRKKGLGGTSLLELNEWSSVHLGAQVPEGKRVLMVKLQVSTAGPVTLSFDLQPELAEGEEPASVFEGEHGSDWRSTVKSDLDRQLRRELLDDEPDAQLLARAEREREELGDGQVRPFVSELRERGRVTAAEWAVPMNSYERRELVPVLVDSVFLEHLLHGAGNVDPGSPGTYNWALVHENVPEALRRWRRYLRELVVRELDERLEHPAPLLHDAALAFARAKNTAQMAQALRELMDGAEAYSKVVP